MWENSLENVRFGDRRNEKNRDEITIRKPGALAEIQTEQETKTGNLDSWTEHLVVSK
jgi:hypothetical protein